MFIVAIHLFIGFAVSLFLIFTKRPQVYVELKEEKLVANGDVDTSYGKSQQVSVTESVKRYYLSYIK